MSAVESAEYQAGYSRNVSGMEVALSGFFSSIGLYEKPNASQKKAALREMDFLGIAHLADKKFHAMSYGEARRVPLARALVNRPMCWTAASPGKKIQPLLDYGVWG